MNFINLYPASFDESFCHEVLETFRRDLPQLQMGMKYSEGASTYKLPLNEDRWSEVAARVVNVAESKLKNYLSPVANLVPHKYMFRSLSMLKYEAGAGVPLHYDEELSPDGNGKNFIFLIYLNSVSVGGELVFPLQNEVIRPEPGLMVIFPTFFTHPHQVIPSLVEERYCLRIEYQIDQRVWYTKGEES